MFQRRRQSSRFEKFWPERRCGAERRVEDNVEDYIGDWCGNARRGPLYRLLYCLHDPGDGFRLRTQTNRRTGSESEVWPYRTSRIKSICTARFAK